MEYIIRYTDEAINDLFVIYNYIANYAKELLNALRLVNEIRNSIYKLRDFPYKNPEIPKQLLGRSDIRYMVVKRHIVVYSIDDNEMVVNILRIFNSRRDITKIKLLK